MTLIVLLTILFNNNLFAHSKVGFDELLFEIENKEIVNDTTFTLDPKRWGIVEGRVSDEIAIKNRDILNTVMAQLKKFGINTMEIGAMDAYFKVD
ncbi:hypothetical protein, partial [Thalassobellus citreus]|uniref:hypothetical protein n=1 Tax=Thalassobellus citreus TaxID=3367752 RepID=UPI0037AF52E4